MANRVTAKELDDVLNRLYAWSRERRYVGFNKHDALTSPILNTVLGWSKWTRIVAIQGVMRFPINIRPVLCVRKVPNPKGLALFAMGLLDRYRATGASDHLDEARKILGQLLDLRSKGPWAGNCWGYQYPWQDPGFFAPAGTPNAVVTCFVCEAFLEAYRLTGDGRYLDIVQSASSFLVNNLTVLKDTRDELCLSYMPLPMSMRVMDVSILVASVLLQTAALAKETTHLEPGKKLLNYILQQQTSYGAWFYTDPPSDSPIGHDNYHTGFILDALWRIMKTTGDQSLSSAYRSGLDFYAEKLFNGDGSPRWMSDRDYPHDVHGAAQGILTFSRHSLEYPGLADRIARWTLDNLYHHSGRFSYQQGRYWKRRFTLMRWCNGWMARALSTLQLSRQTATGARHTDQQPST